MIPKTSNQESTEISLTEANGRLTELALRAAAGEEIVLMRYRRPLVRLVPIAMQGKAAHD